MKKIVQINVDRDEIDRRISAFIGRKRKEIDEWNAQEFCGRPFIEEENPLWEEINTCARTDAVFVPRFGNKSHIKVSRVENRWGPQTQIKTDISKHIKKETNDTTNLPIESIHERLQNMESHLKLKSDSHLRCNVFERLKKLEDRILFLEGLSPDYLHYTGSHFTSPKKFTSEKEKFYSNLSVEELQNQIQSLKESLKSKSNISNRESKN